MTPRRRQRLSGLARLLVCLAAVAWLVHDPNWRWGELRDVVRSANWRLILLSVLAFGPAPVLIAIRLQWLLAVHGIYLSAWQAIKVTFAGNFIIWALPVGTTGGDTAKAFLIAKDTPHKHEAVTTVFFDRVIGVVGLILMSGAMILLDWHNPAFARWGRMVGVLSIVFFGGAGVYFSPRIRRRLGIDWLLARLPLASHLQRIDRAVLAFRHWRRRMAASLLLTLVLQAVAILSLFLAGWGLGMAGERPLRALGVYFAYTPICFLAGVLPIGVMEVTFVQLFSATAGFGTPGAAVSLSLLGRLIQLIWALPGALVVLRGGSYQRVREVAAADASVSPAGSDLA